MPHLVLQIAPVHIFVAASAPATGSTIYAWHGHEPCPISQSSLAVEPRGYANANVHSARARTIFKLGGTSITVASSLGLFSISVDGGLPFRVLEKKDGSDEQRVPPSGVPPFVSLPPLTLAMSDQIPQKSSGSTCIVN